MHLRQPLQRSIRANYKRQKRFIARIHKHKEAAAATNDAERVNSDEQSKMEVDGDSGNVDDAELTSLDSEERAAINSDDEMKKLEDFETELQDDVDAKAITEDDLGPIVAKMCKNWNFTEQRFTDLTHSWYIAHSTLLVEDAAWQLCREKARMNETERRRKAAIDAERERLRHLRELREQLAAREEDCVLRDMIRDDDNLPDFAALDRREQAVAEWKDAKKRGDPPYLSEEQLAKIVGVESTTKVGAAEIKKELKGEVIILPFALKKISRGRYYFKCSGKKVAGKVQFNAIYYCIAHYRELIDLSNKKEAPSSQSLGFVQCIDSILDVQCRESSVYIDIAKNQKNKNDAVRMLKVYKERGGDLNVIDKDGKSMLMHAVWNENLELIQWLLSEKVNINVSSAKGKNNLLHILMNHIERNKQTNIRQLFHCISNKRKGALKKLTKQFNSDGYDPLLLGIRHLVEDRNYQREYRDYFKQKDAEQEWNEKCDKLDENRQDLKAENLRKWHDRHPIDYTEIDLDEIDMKIECAEWRMLPKPIDDERKSSLNTNSSSYPFSALNSEDQNMLMCSQPVDDQDDSEMNRNPDSEDERGPAPKPMNVTETVKKMMTSNNSLNISQNTDLHKMFKTEKWNDHKWSLEVCVHILGCLATD